MLLSPKETNVLEKDTKYGVSTIILSEVSTFFYRL